MELVHYQERFQCEICLKTFTTKRYLRIHKVMIKCQPIRFESANQLGSFQCELCLNIYITKQNLIMHQVKCKPVSYRCKHCRQIFNSELVLSQHKNEFHYNVPMELVSNSPAKRRKCTEEIRSNCEHCPDTFALKEQLDKHILVNHFKTEENSVVTLETVDLNRKATEIGEECPVEFNRNKNIKTEPSWEESFESPIREVSDTNIKMEAEEMPQDQNERNEKADYAQPEIDSKEQGKKFNHSILEFKSNSIVNKNPVEVNKFNCCERPEEFKWKEQFTKHVIEKHSLKSVKIEPEGSEPIDEIAQDLDLSLIRCWYCQACNSKFPTKIELVDHTKKHYRCTYHPCSFCPLQFKLKDNLDKHELTHDRDEVVQCFFCKEIFASEHNMAKHTSDCLKEKPFQCPKCPLWFKRQSALNAHVLNCCQK